MKPLTSFFLSISLLSAAAPSAFGSTKEIDVTVSKALRLSQDTLNPGERRELAEVALAYWRNFDSRIPRLSPSETKWIEEELNTQDTSRLTKVVNSKEYALWQLKNLSSNCVDLFEQLPSTVGGDKFVELYMWMKTVSCDATTHGTVQYLQLAGLGDGRFAGSFNLMHASLMCHRKQHSLRPNDRKSLLCHIIVSTFLPQGFLHGVELLLGRWKSASRTEVMPLASLGKLSFCARRLGIN
ncbi:hypothetical protein EOB36_10845 [Mesorhizobium sp. M6A.T.Cr.TU.017.01.1.1]|nr:hypothetical protein EOB36_10845 [Mesorhizobium sp. M6A.T.Cr.TU.017.01.1.1]